MKLNRDSLDLGVDPDSGEKNILVMSASEFFKLHKDKQPRAWSSVKVASEITGRPAITIYQHCYQGKTPTKIIKKNHLDRGGHILVRPYLSIEEREEKIKRDRHRIVRTLRRSLDRTSWLSLAQRIGIIDQVTLKLHEFERDNKGKRDL